MITSNETEYPACFAIISPNRIYKLLCNGRPSIPINEGLPGELVAVATPTADIAISMLHAKQRYGPP